MYWRLDLSDDLRLKIRWKMCEARGGANNGTEDEIGDTYRIARGRGNPRKHHT